MAVAQIEREDGLITRAATSRMIEPVDELAALRACLYGRGSVAARPEDADWVTTQYLLVLGRSASVYYGSDPLLGETLSVLRPIVRAYIDQVYSQPRSRIIERVLTFGEAGLVPLGSSVRAEEGNYLHRRFGSSVTKYRALGPLIEDNRDIPLRELCDRAEAAILARDRWIVEQYRGNGEVSMTMNEAKSLGIVAIADAIAVEAHAGHTDKLGND